MPQGGRKTQLQVIHEISVQLTPASPDNGVLGVLPAGAVMVQSRYVTSQPFNSTTNFFGFGTTPGGGEVLAGVDLKVAGRNDVVAPIAVAGPMVANTPIYFVKAATGPAPTQGVVTAWIEYLPGPG